MADDDEEDKGTGTPPAPPDDDKESSRIISINALSDKVDQVFEWMKGNGGQRRGGTRADDAADVGAQVRAELGKLRDDEGRRQRGGQISGRLDLVEQTLKTITEKTPKEHRWITRKLWGGDDD